MIMNDSYGIESALDYHPSSKKGDFDFDSYEDGIQSSEIVGRVCDQSL